MQSYSLEEYREDCRVLDIFEKEFESKCNVYLLNKLKKYIDMNSAGRHEETNPVIYPKTMYTIDIPARDIVLKEGIPLVFNKYKRWYKKATVRYMHCYIFIQAYVNKNDKEPDRAWWITLELKGNVRGFKCRHWHTHTLTQYVRYSMSQEESLKSFLDWLRFDESAMSLRYLMQHE